ncbi:MAG: tyrosine recombinase XerC [Janthinobacterium lividum]
MPETAAPEAPLPASMLAYLTRLADERRYSEHTLRSYRFALAQLAALAGERPLEALTATDIRQAASRAHARGLGGRSIAQRLSAWRGFYKWYALQTPLPANPVDTVRAPKRPRPLPKALSADHASALMDSVDGTTLEALRDRALLELFYSSGLRLAELIGLDVRFAEIHDPGQPTYRSAGWIDLQTAEVTVTGKGGRRRAVPIGTQACAALHAWLAVRDNWVRQDRQPLFLSRRGTRLSPSFVRTRVKQLALTAGIPANVHPHVLRHSFATHVLQSSGDLRAVQEMLGHASISATQVYTSLDFQHLSRVYDQAHPRAKRRGG